MSKYKVGDKFIVEIKEVLNDELPYDTENLYRIDGFKTLVFDDYGLDKLQKINPKLKIEDIDDMLAEHDLKKESYEKGLNDVWELAKKIMYGLTRYQLKEIFGTDNEASILSDAYTPQQVLAKIDAYEKSQQIQVGDVVKVKDETYEFVVTALNGMGVQGIGSTGNIFTVSQKGVEKTGRHIDIEHLLEQIRGNE